MFDTIVAVATPLMKSALAIIRVSGNDCFEIVSKICKKDLTSINKREIVYGHIYDREEVIDEVVMNVYVGPKSFTGENLIEVGDCFLNNNQKLRNKILSEIEKRNRKGRR